MLKINELYKLNFQHNHNCKCVHKDITCFNVFNTNKFDVLTSGNNVQMVYELKQDDVAFILDIEKHIFDLNRYCIKVLCENKVGWVIQPLSEDDFEEFFNELKE